MAVSTGLIVFSPCLLFLLSRCGAEPVVSNKTERFPGWNFNEFPLITRDEWKAAKPARVYAQNDPVNYIIISHSAIPPKCPNRTACSNFMVSAQTYHLSRGSSDIGYNFVIGGDSGVYEARGWQKRTFHTNVPDNLGIHFSGNYEEEELIPGQVRTVKELLRYGVERKFISENYQVIAHNQTYNTLSPGKNIYKEIIRWKNYSNQIFSWP